MFKKGDKVECLYDFVGEFTKGKIYVVRENYVTGRLEIEMDDSGSSTNGATVGAWRSANSQSTAPQVAAMFKVGDKVECLANYTNSFTKGKIYEVSYLYNNNGRITGTVGVVADDSGKANGWAAHNFKLAPPIATIAPTTSAKTNFQVGDILECLVNITGMFTKGKMYKVSTNQHVGLVGIVANDKGGAIDWYANDFKLASPSLTGSNLATVLGVPMAAWIHDIRPTGMTIKHGPKCECGNSKNPIGQGHSGWCDLFKKEF